MPVPILDNRKSSNPLPYHRQQHAVAPVGKFNSALAEQLFGARGEVKIETLESDKDFCLGVFKNGLWEQRRTPIGKFRFQKLDFNVPYLKTESVPEFELSLPKIPGRFLHAIVEFFRLVMKKFNGAEVMIQIFWNKTTEKYEVFVPTQKVSGASVSFEHDLNLQVDPERIWVFDIHSHNSMGAFFSGGDNADEKSTRLFGVIGKLHTDNWEGKWRSGVNGKYCMLNVEDVFDLSDTVRAVIGEKALEKVSRGTVIPVYKYKGATGYIPASKKVPTYNPGAEWGAYNYGAGSAFPADAIAHNFDDGNELPDALFHNLSRAEYQTLSENAAGVVDFMQNIIDQANSDTVDAGDLDMAIESFCDFAASVKGWDRSDVFDSSLKHFSGILNDSDFHKGLSDFIDYVE